MNLETRISDSQVGGSFFYSAASHKFGSTQVNLPPDVAAKMAAFPIKEEDLTGDGRELDPHITVKYGLLDVDPSEVAAALAGEKPAEATMGKTIVFEGVEDGTADAVVVEIHSDCLRRWNQKIEDSVETTESKYNYKPHATIAYVKPGLGQKYANNSGFEGTPLTFDRIIVSSKDDQVVSLPIDGSLKAAGGPGSGRYPKGSGRGKSAKGVYELGAVKQGVVIQHPVDEDELFNIQHADYDGMEFASGYFRFVEGEIHWNEQPSADDYFAVDNAYAGYRGVKHFVYGNNDGYGGSFGIEPKPIQPPQPRSLGGPGSGRYPKGSGKKSGLGAEAIFAESQHQEQLAAEQTNPLAHPSFALGHDGMREDGGRYIAAYGQEFKADQRPDDIEQGTPKECYRNASLLVMTRPDLTYAEGYASKSPGGLAILHAWAVDTNGKVVDPTLSDQESWHYFGVKYDRKAYLKYLYTAKIYGVLGSTNENARKAVLTGAPELRSGLKTLRTLWANKDGIDYHGRPPKTSAVAVPASAPSAVAGGFTRSSNPAELSAHSARTLDALDKKTAQPYAVLSLKEHSDKRTALIKSLGGEARAQAEYAHTPTADLAVLKSIRVENKPVSGQAHCTWNREVVMGSTSASGDFRHELGHAIHMSLSPELQGRAKKLFDVAKAKAQANPAGLQKKLSHEFYEKTYGVIGRRGLDNWHENFAEHYRGYHKAVFQTQSGEDKGALGRYAKTHPDWNAFWDARYSTIGK